MSAARQLLADKLTELLPTHKIVRAQRNVDTISKPTVVIKQQSIIPAPAAPLSHYQVTFVVTIVSAHADIEKAEDDLDELVPDLIRKLDSIGWLLFESAEKASYADSNLCYDLRIQTITAKE